MRSCTGECKCFFGGECECVKCIKNQHTCGQAHRRVVKHRFVLISNRTYDHTTHAGTEGQRGISTT